ncbi:MAG: response regulator transcription factor [Crocinitomicaceae bacterium]|jgi:two-component system alkaline phosphatase synthesis response regulator PhoP|nr:response regulator transcription factor [Crocinitomicaceae bacterium]
MKRICVVEDEESLSDLIKMNLELEGYAVEVITHGTEAFLRAFEMDTFDLVVLDVMLPEVSGLTICKEIRKYSRVPILFLSAKGTVQDRIAGLKIGANDYLPKPFDLEELLLRVQVLVEGIEEVSSPIERIKIGNHLVDFTTFQVKHLDSNESIDLSKREIELLRLFYTKNGLVISREDILDALWGNDQFPTSRTIDNYILTFRKVFEEDPKNPRFFHSIRGVGYKFTLEN